MQPGVLAVCSRCLRSPRLGNGTASDFTDAWLLSGAPSSDGFDAVFGSATPGFSSAAAGLS
jgi:hypothetical protein